MDILQLALIFLVVMLAIFLSVLGIQVFFILSDLRKSLSKLEKFINEVESVGHEVEQVSKVIGNKFTGGNTTPHHENGVENSVRRLFKRNLRN